MNDDDIDNNKWNIFYIAISPKIKEEMQTQFDILLGYDDKTMFPEIDGYSKYHSANSEFKYDFFK